MDTMATASMKKELLDLSDWAWGRTRTRLEGLSDEEYFWQPYPGCWTVRQLADGSWVSDWVGTEPAIPPLTTIAWRMVHLIGSYGGARNSEWLGVATDLAPSESWDTPPTTAAEAIGRLEEAQARWRAVLEGSDNAGLAQLLGPIAGQYAPETRASFACHMVDEVIHHSAEVGVMRDLYRAAKGSLHADPLVARLMAGDAAAWDEAAGRGDLVSELATVGRWDLVETALGRGLDPNGPSPTALHRAAAHDLIPIVEQLLSAGADITSRDPQFQATPAEWADFFGHKELAERLRDRSA